MYNIILSAKNTYPKLEYNESFNNVIENNYIKNNSVCFVYSKNKKVLFSNTKKNIINSIQHKLYKNAKKKNVKTNSNGLQWFIEISI